MAAASRRSPNASSIRYYASIAPVLLPYLADRPLNLHRFPDGVDHKGFWQKQAPKYTPEWIPRWDNVDADPGESEQYLVADSAAALAWLANHAAVELHPWTSRIADVAPSDLRAHRHRPRRQATTWDELLTPRPAAPHRARTPRRARLPEDERAGAASRCGSRSHPARRSTRPAAWVERAVADGRQGRRRRRERRLGEARRGGRARLDYTQNAINKTLVAPYSVRAAPGGAPVSMPINWDELDDPELRSDRWTIRTAVGAHRRGRRPGRRNAARPTTSRHSRLTEPSRPRSLRGWHPSAAMARSTRASSGRGGSRCSARCAPRSTPTCRAPVARPVALHRSSCTSIPTSSTRSRTSPRRCCSRHPAGVTAPS